MDIALRRQSRHELIGIKAQSMSASAPQAPEAPNGPDNVAESSGSPNQTQSSDESQNGRPDPPSTNRPQSDSPQIQDNRAQEGESTGQTGGSSSSRKTKRKKSAGIWDSLPPNGIALMSLTITLLLGISAWVYQSRADKSAEEANQLAAEGNRLAAVSNRIALWELCKSEEEIQNTATCIELMKSGIPPSEKRGVSHRVPVRELRYPEDFELFTRHHGLLMHLLAQRLQLNRELHALNNNGRQQGRSEDSPSTDSGGQFKHLTDSISVSENYILALLSFMCLPENGAGDLSLTPHRERENQISSSQSLELQYGTEPEECRRVESEFDLQVPASMGTGEQQRPSRTDLPPFTNNSIGYLEKLIVRYSTNELAMAVLFLWTFSFWNLSLLTYYVFKAFELYDRLPWFSDIISMLRSTIYIKASRLRGRTRSTELTKDISVILNVLEMMRSKVLDVQTLTKKVLVSASCMNITIMLISLFLLRFLVAAIFYVTLVIGPLSIIFLARHGRWPFIICAVGLLFFLGLGLLIIA